MPYIKKGGITYGGFPNATVASKEATAIVPSSIKQLTRVGGTQEFAPVTIPEAVKFSEGGSLETTVNSIATIESSSTASKAYVVGDFLVSGGQLYKVIADIAIGETFVVDTNIESTSVGSELSALNAGLTEWENIPVTVSLSTGSSLTVTCAKRNGIIKFTVDGYKSSSTAAGSNIIRANITGNMGTFVYVCFCAGFYDGSVLVARMESTSATTAELLVRVAGANSAGSDAHVIGICFTELT